MELAPFREPETCTQAFDPGSGSEIPVISRHDPGCCGSRHRECSGGKSCAIHGAVSVARIR